MRDAEAMPESEPEKPGKGRRGKESDAAARKSSGRRHAKKKAVDKVNINDVASAAGVSRTTVSNFLNNKGNAFSSETHDRIRKAIADLRYIPDPGARSLKSAEGSKSVGLVLRDNLDFVVNAMFFQNVLPAIGKALEEYGYRPLIIPETGNRDADIRYIRELARGLLAGYILFAIAERDDPYVEALELDGIDYICVGYNDQVRDFVSQRFDVGSYRAVSHLIEAHGVKRITPIHYKASFNARRDSLRGYRDALADHGIKPEERLVIESEGHAEEIEALIHRLFDSPSPPEAVIIPQVLAGVIDSAVQKMGLRIPDDLKVVIFDHAGPTENRQYAKVQMQSMALGREAARKIVGKLRREESGRGGMFLDLEFIPGRSCGCK